MSSAFVSFERAQNTNFCQLKVAISSGRTKPVLACLQSIADFCPNNWASFHAPLILRNKTHTDRDPIVVYYAYMNGIHYLYVPESSINAAEKDDAYVTRLPIVFSPNQTEIMRNFNFSANPQRNTYYALHELMISREFDTNIKDFLSMFALTY